VKRRHKLIKIIGILLLLLGFFLIVILFTTPGKRLSKHEGSFVRIMGDVSDLKQASKDSIFGKDQGTMGGKDLCHPDSPFGECYPPEGSIWAGPKEILELELDEKQVTDLVNEFKPDSLLISDIRFKFNDNIAIIEATSLYPIAPGIVRAEIRATKYKFVVDKLYIGRIPAPESVRKMLEQSLDSLIINSLSSYGVGYSSLNIRDGHMYAKVYAPSDLVQIDDDGVLIINADVIQQQERYKVPEDYNII
jgi:hypothetical protein